MVGVAARVAAAQLPWHSVEAESTSDVTNHIAALEAMLAEIQLRVRAELLASAPSSPPLNPPLSAGSRSLLVRGGDPASLGRGCQRTPGPRRRLGGSDGGRGGQQDRCVFPASLLRTGLCGLEVTGSSNDSTWYRWRVGFILTTVTIHALSLYKNTTQINK